MTASTQDYGRRIIPSIVDERAQSEPDRIVYSTPLSDDVSKGFRDITARQFAATVNKTSWWLHKEVGTSSSFETVAYIGPRMFLISTSAAQI